MGEYIQSKNAPPHLFIPGATYFITACTYKRLRLLDHHKKHYFQKTLICLTGKYGWNLEAWAILDNHYHIISRAPDTSHRITNLIQPLHSITVKYFNQVDHMRGRKVWQNYWDTCLTHEKSYLARMHYVMLNPVVHGFVADPAEYPFSSYCWFINHADQELKHKVLSSSVDRLNILDGF